MLNYLEHEQNDTPFEFRDNLENVLNYHTFWVAFLTKSIFRIFEIILNLLQNLHYFKVKLFDLTWSYSWLILDHGAPTIMDKSVATF